MKMNMAQKVLLIIGGAFAGIGAVLTMIFGSIGMVFRPMRAFLALPLFFLILGICFIAAVLFGQHKKSLIVKKRNQICRKDLRLRGEYGVYGKRQIPGECDRALF